MMGRKEDARPGIAVPRRAVENGTASQTAHASTTEFTTPPAERQPLRIADFLSPGQQNARPLRHLKELTGLPGREVRRMIQAERLEGIPVLSDNSAGYYLPADDQERERFVRSMRHRAREICAVADAVEQGGDGA